MPLGMEVGLGPGDFVFDGDPACARKKRAKPPPNFWPVFIVGHGWMDQDATGTEVNLGPINVVLNMVAAPP